MSSRSLRLESQRPDKSRTGPKRPTFSFMWSVVSRTVSRRVRCYKYKQFGAGLLSSRDLFCFGTRCKSELTVDDTRGTMTGSEL